MSSIVTDFLKEAHKHPLFTLGLSFVTVGFIYFAMSNFAWSTDVNELKKDVYNIQITMARNQLESRVDDLESQIWDLEQKEKKAQIDSDESDRLGKLVRERDKKKRELDLIPALQEK